ncbi:MAG: hypothetical protein P9M14_05280 [Candidatus Alcyoniella australis]|nr:hypothetical protein [Candidatus Alcyoniella australis]
MKLTLIGAGGIRTPLFISSLLGRPQQAGISELMLYDNDKSRMPLMRRMGARLIQRSGAGLKLKSTHSLSQAVDGASLVITTIRVGKELGRTADERIAMRLGLLAQETTGLCGFSFAARSIPALLEIAKQVAKRAPRCWLVNFTNPAGLVTQAMHDAGFNRSVGVCDSASALARHVANERGLGLDDIELGVIGLNHLSFVTQARLNGRSILGALVRDSGFLRRNYGVFQPTKITDLGAIPNEYLYYFWRHAHAMQVQSRKKQTRGDQVLELTNRFLEAAGKCRNAEELLEAHEQMIASRESSYMSAAWGKGRQRPTDALSNEGYAGVALNFLNALHAEQPRRMVLILPNHSGALDLPRSDTIESSCVVGPEGPRAIPVKRPAPSAVALLRRIKTFESLSSRAIITRDKRAALEALSIHPLIGPKQAQRALSALLKEHAEYVGNWS